MSENTVKLPEWATGEAGDWHRAEVVSGADLTRTVGTWTRHLMRREMEQGGMLDATVIERDAPQWPGFVRELFGELYGLGTRVLEDPAAGSAWVAEILEQAAQLPEWQDLKARSEGDPWRCGVGTSSAVTALGQALEDALDMMPEQDPQKAQEAAQEAEQAADQAQAAAQAAAAAQAPDAAQKAQEAAQAEERAQEAGEAAEQAAAAAQAVLEALQEQGGAILRGALREAAEEAHDEISGMEAALAGLGHGHGAGALTGVKAPAAEVQEALRKNEKLRRIAAIAGRLRLSAKKQQATKCDFGREEICNVEQGGDVQRLLPSELVMFADPDLEPLVLRKVVEREALQYQLRGTEKAERGPIVVMMDGSGSMEGARHEWAMGVALAMLEVAAMQNRALALVHFGSKVIKSDVIANPRALTLPKLIEMVTFWANSGTNIQASLKWVGDELLAKEQALQGADVLLVTDGESGNFSASVRDLRQRFGAATYGVAIETDWKEYNRAELEDYHQVTDEQIAIGAENINGVLGL